MLSKSRAVYWSSVTMQQLTKAFYIQSPRLQS
jgi:hypothetical protein